MSADRSSGFDVESVMVKRKTTIAMWWSSNLAMSQVQQHRRVSVVGVL